jgi:RNA polymerase sigma factor (sigma-70 family)
MQTSERGLKDGRDELLAKLRELHLACFTWSLHCCRGDRSEAEEVLQTVYLKVLEGRARYQGKSSLRTWVFSVIRATAREARRRLARGLRAVGRSALQPDESVEALAPAEVYAAEVKERVHRLLAGLSSRQREMVRLVFYHDLTVAEAAEVMGVSLGSASRHYERAKENLKRRLEHIEDFYERARRADQAST